MDLWCCELSSKYIGVFYIYEIIKVLLQLPWWGDDFAAALPVSYVEEDNEIDILSHMFLGKKDWLTDVQEHAFVITVIWCNIGVIDSSH